MKRKFLLLFCCITSLTFLHSQEVAKAIAPYAFPVRNSLKFNRFIINPTFSFVREQNSYISIYNKRENTQFENSPVTYLISYSGRFSENQGASLGVFQNNYGILSTTGAFLNFAQNVQTSRDNNLTFGLNISAYKNGLNQGKIITNYDDPLLANYPSSTLVAITPAINYGTYFLDFGLALNNFFTYDFTTSGLLKDPEAKAIEAHIMYTGYLETNSFLDGAKFTGLLKTVSNSVQKTFSGQAMLSLPSGIWAQTGYNNFYGISAGFGMNVSNKISLEYNYEKEMGKFTLLGSAHELTIAYRFASNKYGDVDEEEAAFLIKDTPAKPVAKAKPVPAKPKVDTAALAKAAAEKAKQDKLLAEAKAKAAAEKAEKDKLLAAENAKIAAEKAEKDKLLAAENAKKAAEQAKLSAEARAKAAAEKAKQDKLNAEARAKAAAEKARLDKIAQDAKAKADADAALKTKKEAEDVAKANNAKAKADRDAAEKAAAEKARLDKIAQDAKAKADVDAALKAKKDAEDVAKASDAKAKAERDAAEKAAAEKARLDKISQDAKAKADADAALKAKKDAEDVAKASDAKAKAERDAAEKAAAEKARLDKIAQDAKAKADADAALKAKKDAEDVAKANDAKAKADRDAAEKAAAEKARLDKIAQDAKAKADADAALKAKKDAEDFAKASDAKAKADRDAAEKAAAEKARLDKIAQDAKAKADADAALKAKKDAEDIAKANDAKAKAERDAAEKAAAEKARLDKIAQDAKAKADTDAAEKAKLLNEQQAIAAAEKAKADAEALKAKQLADEKAKADQLANAKKDEKTVKMENIAENIEYFSKNQQDLLAKLNETVDAKAKELKEMKDENDLSDKGIASAPKPFKSVSAENAKLDGLKTQLSQLTQTQKSSIEELTALYNDRNKNAATKNDAVSQSYLQRIEKLRAEQTKVEQANTRLLASLEEIKIQTEIEKKRRIKRASADTDQSRFEQDQVALKRIIETTPKSPTPLTVADFNFGTTQGNMQILKNINTISKGYYVILGVHSDSANRDEFLRKVVASGQKNINFFYNQNTSEYFIYTNRYESLKEATDEQAAKGTAPYNQKMSIVKLE